MQTITAMTDQEHVLRFKIEDELVMSRTMDQATAKSYAVTCIERARAYAERIKTMSIPLYLQIWAVDMAAATGKVVVKVHHNYLPWVQAFLVVRYGEAVDCWPDHITDKDIERARDWKSGNNVPTVVRA